MAFWAPFSIPFGGLLPKEVGLQEKIATGLRSLTCQFIFSFRAKHSAAEKLDSAKNRQPENLMILVYNPINKNLTKDPVKNDTGHFA